MLMIQSREISKQDLQAQIDRLESMPNVGAILQPLLSYLNRPLEQQDVRRIVDLISHDHSLTAQCLRMANSPLHARWQNITSTSGAVMSLGLQRLKDVVLSCCFLNLMPPGHSGCDPATFWEHSLACALVARKLAKRIGVTDPEQVYLAGLLHDLGFVVNLHLAPDLFSQAIRKAEMERLELIRVEEELLGFSHSDSGKLLAERWQLTPLVQSVILHHHGSHADWQAAPETGLILLSDQLCRQSGLGYGFKEDFSDHPQRDRAIEGMKGKWPVARNADWASIERELETYVSDVRKLVSVLFRFQAIG